VKRSVNKAYRFRLYPNKEQAVLLAKTFGCCRFIYNQMLSDKIEEYKKSGKMKKNTPAMYKKQYPWLKEVDSLALANVQLHLEKAYKNFFRDPKIGFPKFKSKHSFQNSYTTNYVNGNIALVDGKIKLPKLGMVCVKRHRMIPETYKLKSVTISQVPSGKYFISILFAYENQVSECTGMKEVLGIDFAMNGMAVFSDGTRASYPMFYKKAQKKLVHEQRNLSRCKKGSSNYQKQKMKVAKYHEKIRNQRQDFSHKLSRQITNKYDVVCVEDLNMKAMSQCLHFGKGVMDNGYGRFLNMMEYKLSEQGKDLVKVDRFYPSTKRCSQCGNVKKMMLLSERTYHCACGNNMDRDVNAAINIREEGIRILSDSRKCA
jgi:putative transposase